MSSIASGDELPPTVENPHVRGVPGRAEGDVGSMRASVGWIKIYVSSGSKATFLVDETQHFLVFFVFCDMSGG